MGGGLVYLRAQPDEECRSQLHLPMLLVSGLVVVAYVVGIPALYAGTVYYGLTHNKLVDTSFQRRFAFMYDNFELEWVFWTVALFLRRLVMAAILVLGAGDPLQQVALAMIALAVAGAAHFFARPYLDTSLDLLDSTSLTNLGFNLLVGTVYYTESLHGMNLVVWKAAYFVTLLMQMFFGVHLFRCQVYEKRNIQTALKAVVPELQNFQSTKSENEVLMNYLMTARPKPSLTMEEFTCIYCELDIIVSHSFKVSRARGIFQLGLELHLSGWLGAMKLLSLHPSLYSPAKAAHALQAASSGSPPLGEKFHVETGSAKVSVDVLRAAAAVDELGRRLQSRMKAMKSTLFDASLDSTIARRVSRAEYEDAWELEVAPARAPGSELLRDGLWMMMIDIMRRQAKGLDGEMDALQEDARDGQEGKAIRCNVMLVVLKHVAVGQIGVLDVVRAAQMDVRSLEKLDQLLSSTMAALAPRKNMLTGARMQSVDLELDDNENGAEPAESVSKIAPQEEIKDNNLDRSQSVARSVLSSFSDLWKVEENRKSQMELLTAAASLFEPDILKEWLASDQSDENLAMFFRLAIFINESIGFGIEEVNPFSAESASVFFQQLLDVCPYLVDWASSAKAEDVAGAASAFHGIWSLDKSDIKILPLLNKSMLPEIASMWLRQKQSAGVQCLEHVCNSMRSKAHKTTTTHQRATAKLADSKRLGSSSADHVVLTHKEIAEIAAEDERAKIAADKERVKISDSRPELASVDSTPISSVAL
ncbi:hypothetical protein CYMTET_11553 [Cymbomonas tetramitiformis]|uniref:Uncharacterized protein n=1 Tax=Cymbomonas tetramitiformis TaxID=36881 RepID=A0AAE0GM21_9CHLO|nr:hypothetical protein CYMTET_11553 [Cymbomonas tetramitiformis]